jgi:uncharacterized protein YcbX
MPRAQIAALNVYPVKSCRGIGLAEALVTTRGLVAATPSASVGDRYWMIVSPNGKFVTQRDDPRLALIETSIAAGNLVLSTAGAMPLVLPLESRGDDAREVTVWDSTVPARDAGDTAAGWLSSVLGADLRLVRFDPAHRRPCNPAYAGDSGAHTAFADGYPLLVVGEASLADLNLRLAARDVPALSMNRFRPNLVLAGIEPYDEDHIDTLVADGVTLKLVKPCTRCQITTTDQDSGRVGQEPLATLAGYRTDVRLAGVTFGMNAVVVAGEGLRLSVGDGIEARFAF